MFEGRFSEILIIFVLALVVLGPEKLPRVVTELGRWVGRARSMARQFREQLEEEVQLEEARKAQRSAPPPAPPPVHPGAEEPPLTGTSYTHAPAGDAGDAAAGTDRPAHAASADERRT